MPKIFPFEALRPKADYVGMVTSKSTDFPNQEDLVHEIRVNPFTFHHVTKSHLSYSGAFQEPEKFLPFAAQYITDLKNKGVLVKDKQPAFYLYEQIRKDGKKFEGIIALCGLEDYHNNKIKKHEEIRPSRLKFLVELFKTTKVMGEPTLLAHNGHLPIENIEKEKVFSFVTIDEKKHTVHRICKPQDIQLLQKAMEQIDALYIADGHHRTASTAEFNSSVSHLENDKFLCFIVNENQLEILPFHRLIKPLEAVPIDVLLTSLEPNFIVTPSEDSMYDIKEQNEFGIYTLGQWFKLQLREKSSLMDVEIIEHYIVKTIYAIEDSKTDSQISFHPHTNGERSLCQLIDEGTYSVAITNKACSFSEVRTVADANKTLPAKSTFIEPKLRAGMIIQEFEEHKK